jgi:4-hydroxymandelate oxidase
MNALPVINLFGYEQLAKEHLSQMAFDYYTSGAWVKPKYY